MYPTATELNGGQRGPCPPPPTFWQKNFYVPHHGQRCSLGFLPIPPKSTMVPLVPLAKSPVTTPRLDYANAVERWDAHRNRAGSPSPSSPRPASNNPGHTSSCDRWNTNKKSLSITSVVASRTAGATAVAEPDMMSLLCHL
jgi:hypothetical protein